jgi:hypothetical protein
MLDTTIAPNLVSFVRGVLNVPADKRQELDYPADKRQELDYPADKRQELDYPAAKRPKLDDEALSDEAPSDEAPSDELVGLVQKVVVDTPDDKTSAMPVQKKVLVYDGFVPTEDMMGITDGLDESAGYIPLNSLFSVDDDEVVGAIGIIYMVDDEIKKLFEVDDDDDIDDDGQLVAF